MSYLGNSCKLFAAATVLLSLIGQLRAERAMDEEFRSGCLCYEIYEPVCANNGITYPNACFLTCDRRSDPRILGVCHGECPCCKEPFYNEPLDGQSGWGWKAPESWGKPSTDFETVKENKTENVELPLENAESMVAEEAVMEKAPCLCTADYTPVCGTDGKTYSNGCALLCEARTKPCLEEDCKGECPCPCPCKV